MSVSLIGGIAPDRIVREEIVAATGIKNASQGRCGPCPRPSFLTSDYLVTAGGFHIIGRRWMRRARRLYRNELNAGDRVSDRPVPVDDP